MVRRKIAIIHNDPNPDRYGSMGEGKAILGVLGEVTAVHTALEELGYEVAKVPLAPPIERVEDNLKAIGTDLVFNLFEGFGGQPETEVSVANMLSRMGFTYTGCTGRAISLALDKAKAKEMMISCGISTPRYQLLRPETVSQFNLSYPCIVKPCGEDASHGLSEDSVVYNYASLVRQVDTISRHFGGTALVEEFVEGREFNATVMGNDETTVLPISEIVFSLPHEMPRILTYAAKWEEGTPYFNGTTVVCPAEVEADERARLERTAIAVFRLLIQHGYARVDMRMDAKGTIQVLEANPNPDITPEAGASRQAAAASMTYTQFIEKIVSLALQRKTR